MLLRLTLFEQTLSFNVLVSPSRFDHFDGPMERCVLGGGGGGGGRSEVLLPPPPPPLFEANTLKTGILMTILPGIWRYRVSARSGWPGVTILRDSTFDFSWNSVAACEVVQADLFLRHNVHLAGTLKPKQPK